MQRARAPCLSLGQATWSRVLSAPPFKGWVERENPHPPLRPLTGGYRGQRVGVVLLGTSNKGCNSFLLLRNDLS